LMSDAGNPLNGDHRDPRCGALLISGHSAKGKSTKLIQGEWRAFSTFSPMALATLERLPLALIRRSIVIRMAMTISKLSRVEMHQADFDIVRRVLIAIADACEPKWGTVARDAAVRLSSRYSDADLKLILLADIKTISTAIKSIASRLSISSLRS